MQVLLVVLYIPVALGASLVSQRRGVSRFPGVVKKTATSLQKDSEFDSSILNLIGRRGQADLEQLLKTHAKDLTLDQYVAECIKHVRRMKQNGGATVDKARLRLFCTHYAEAHGTTHLPGNEPALDELPVDELTQKLRGVSNAMKNAQAGGADNSASSDSLGSSRKARLQDASDTRSMSDAITGAAAESDDSAESKDAGGADDVASEGQTKSSSRASDKQLESIDRSIDSSEEEYLASLSGGGSRRGSSSSESSSSESSSQSSSESSSQSSSSSSSSSSDEDSAAQRSTDGDSTDFASSMASRRHSSASSSTGRSSSSSDVRRYDNSRSNRQENGGEEGRVSEATAGVDSFGKHERHSMERSGTLGAMRWQAACFIFCSALFA